MREGVESIKAFVMATVGITEYLGLIKTVKEKVSKMPGVLNVHTVFGRYDLIVEVEAKDLSELGRLVDDKIRAVAGVQSTETFVCYEPL